MFIRCDQGTARALTSAGQPETSAKRHWGLFTALRGLPPLFGLYPLLACAP
jgi:hypothetical protein